MSTRLKAQRRFIHTSVVVVAMLGIVALVSLPWGIAVEGQSIV